MLEVLFIYTNFHHTIGHIDTSTTYIYISMLKTVVLLHIFVETVINFIFRIL